MPMARIGMSAAYESSSSRYKFVSLDTKNTFCLFLKIKGH